MVAVPPRSNEQLALGRALRSLRQGQELSQEALAAKSNLHRNYVGGVERGERNPTYRILLRLAAVVGVPASELLRLAEQELRELRR